MTRLRKTIVASNEQQINNDLTALIQKHIVEACKEIGYDSSDIDGIQILIETGADIDIADIASRLAAELEDWKRETKQNHM